jgi:hypothetical protein
MSKKDCISLANVFKTNKPVKSSPDDVVLFAERTRQWYADFEAVANMLESKYPTFDRVRFIAYITKN